MTDDASDTPAVIGPWPELRSARVYRPGVWYAKMPDPEDNRGVLVGPLSEADARRLVFGPGAAADDPETDGTDAAHPAYWRGHDAGVAGVCGLAIRILDGRDDGSGVSGEPWEGVRRRLLALARPGAAADDGDAVTGAWLVASLGWRERAPGQFASPRLPDGSRTMFRLVYYAEPWGGWHGQSPIQWEITVPGCTQPLVPEPTNRGEVRKLAAALGVPAGEGQ